MAYTISTNRNWDEIAWPNWDDTVEITNGATVIIRKSNLADARKPKQITIIDGTLIIDPALNPTTPGAPIHFKMFSPTEGGIVASSAGKLIVRGQWIDLGTGNGQANQQFLYWPNMVDIFCNHVQVETGAGTNEWIDCVNIGQYNDLSNLPADMERAFYFKNVQYTKNIQFGDGAGNGAVVPVGARVRTQNILLDVKDFYSDQSGNSIFISMEDGGTCDIVRLGTTNAYQLKTSNSGDIKIYDSSFSRALLFNGTARVDINGLFLSKHYSGNEEGRFQNIYGGGTIKRVKNAARTQRSLYAYFCFNVDFEDIWAVSLTVSYSIGAEINFCTNCTFKNLYVVGGYVYIYNRNFNVSIENLKYSSCYRSGFASNVSVLYIYNNYNIKVNGVSLWSPNGQPDSYARVNTAGLVKLGSNFGVRVINANMPYSNNLTSPIIQHMSLNEDIVLARWNLGSVNMELNQQSYSYMKKAKYLNIKADTLPTLCDANLLGLSDVQYKSVTGANLVPSGYNSGLRIGGTTDLAFHTLCDVNGTDGRLALMANIDSATEYFEVLAGTPYFSNKNTLIMRNAGDSGVFTCPFPILGVSGFRNVAPTLISGIITLAHCSISFKQEGGEWSAWYPMNDMATLSALTFDKNKNFYWKLKVTATANNMTGNFSAIHIPVYLDANVQYPVALTTYTLDNVVVGSKYYIYKNSDNSVIGSGTASASTVVITDIPFDTEQTVTVRVRKPGYVPFETGGTLTETGSSTWVSQVQDSIYQ